MDLGNDFFLVLGYWLVQTFFLFLIIYFCILYWIISLNKSTFSIKLVVLIFPDFFSNKICALSLLLNFCVLHLYPGHDIEEVPDDLSALSNPSQHSTQATCLQPDRWYDDCASKVSKQTMQTPGI